MANDLRTHVTRGSTWLRGLFMLLFGVIYGIAEIVLLAVAVFQFLHTLLSGGPNPRLLGFGASLSTFLYQIFSYLTYNSERKPWPFADWPQAHAAELPPPEPSDRD